MKIKVQYVISNKMCKNKGPKFCSLGFTHFYILTFLRSKSIFKNQFRNIPVFLKVYGLLKATELVWLVYGCSSLES